MPTAPPLSRSTHQHLLDAATKERHRRHPENDRTAREASRSLDQTTRCLPPSNHAIRLSRSGTINRAHCLPTQRECVVFRREFGSALPASHFAILAVCPVRKVRLEIFVEGPARHLRSLSLGQDKSQVPSRRKSQA